MGLNRKPKFTDEGAPGCTIVVKLKPNSIPGVHKTMQDFFKHPLVPVAIEKVGTIQYARWVLVDENTFLYTVLFDGDFDKYWEDFHPYFVQAGEKPVFMHAIGWPEDAMTNIPAFVKFFRDHQVNSLGEWGAFGGATQREIRKSLAVNKAFQQVLDNPAAAKALKDPALKPLLDLASD